MAQHHHAREMSFPLLSASQAQQTAALKHIIFVYGSGITNYKILPWQKW
jgi:hypothetical protein